MTEEDEAEAVVQRVLSRYRQASAEPRTGMARAILIVDENVQALAPALREANFRVIVPPSGMSDDVIKETLLPHRIIVTRNTKDFQVDAPVLEYGIISLEPIKFIDPSPKLNENRLAQSISAAITEFDLVAERRGFLLVMRPTGKPAFKKLG